MFSFKDAYSFNFRSSVEIVMRSPRKAHSEQAMRFLFLLTEMKICNKIYVELAQRFKKEKMANVFITFGDIFY